jgi:segregation and condensation protein B
MSDTPDAPIHPQPSSATDASAPPAEEASVEPLSEKLSSEADQKPAEDSAEGSFEEGPALPTSEIRAILEALVFASPHPVTPREIGQVLSGVEKAEWLAAMAELSADYSREGRGLQLLEVAGGYQITTRPEYNDWVRELLSPKTPSRLSIQALETLAVIAYKQPVTLPEIIELRGVKSGGVVKTLLEKRLIRIIGRKEVVGRPMLYGTTKDFLLHFGLKDLGELPKIEEFAEVLGEEVDVQGLKRAIEAPRPAEVPLAEDESGTMAALPFGETDSTPREVAGEPEATRTETPGSDSRPDQD